MCLIFIGILLSSVELLKTSVARFFRAHKHTEHMLHALRYRMTNGLNREFAVLKS